VRTSPPICVSAFTGWTCAFALSVRR
jgi:hypothetical protein